MRIWGALPIRIHRITLSQSFDLNTETFASFDGTRLALHRVGSGTPFILLHGLFSSAQMNWIKWGHAEAIAAAGYEVLMLDFRVHGESEAPHDPANYPQNVLVREPPIAWISA